MGASTVIENVVPALLKIGEAEKVGWVEDEERCAELLQASWLNRVSLGDWREALSETSATDLENVFRALVMLERDGRWAGGSVASTVWLFQLCRERLGEPYALELADWALKNRGNNGYTPFGHGTSATSLRGYRVEQEDKDLRRRAEDEKSQADQDAAKQRRVSREKAHVERQTENAQRSAELMREVRELMSRPPASRLAALAHGTLPLEMIDADWIDAEVLELVDDTILRALIGRIDKRKKNPWHRIRREAYAELMRR